MCVWGGGGGEFSEGTEVGERGRGNWLKGQ